MFQLRDHGSDVRPFRIRVCPTLQLYQQPVFAAEMCDVTGVRRQLSAKPLEKDVIAEAFQGESFHKRET